MKYFEVEPEVAGGFGERTIIDRSKPRITVTHLHYQFDGWCGDALLESTPCYIVTQHLAEQIEGNGLSGVHFAEVEISKSEEFQELHPDMALPAFSWLRVEGVPGEHDFGLTAGLTLVVSERALALLTKHGISHAGSVTPYVS